MLDEDFEDEDQSPKGKTGQTDSDVEEEINLSPYMKKGNTEIDLMMETFDLIVNEKGHTYFWNERDETIEYAFSIYGSNDPVNAGTKYQTYKIGKEIWKCYEENKCYTGSYK